MDYTVLDDIVPLAPQGRRGSQSMRPWAYVRETLPRLRRFLSSEAIDIVHTNDGQIHATWSIAAKLAGVKVLWHHRADPKAKGVNYLAPFTANHVVTVSNFSKPARPVFSLQNKISVVHSPFDHPKSFPDRDESRTALVRELNCGTNARFAGYFGALVERKRPTVFVDIIASFMQQYSEIDLHGVLYGDVQRGSPDLAAAVTSRAKALNISNRIHLMGFRQPIEPHMCAVDVNVVPAINEPFGRTLIESMMLGTPVVAANHGGNIEAINHGTTGYLVEPDHPGSFAKPMHALLSDPALWSRISEEAQAQALTHYNAKNHVDSIVSIYAKLSGRQLADSAG